MATTQVFAVTGMTCGHCVNAVTEEVAKIPGVSEVSVDLVAGGDLLGEQRRQEARRSKTGGRNKRTLGANHREFSLSQVCVALTKQEEQKTKPTALRKRTVGLESVGCSN